MFVASFPWNIFPMSKKDFVTYHQMFVLCSQRLQTIAALTWTNSWSGHCTHHSGNYPLNVRAGTLYFFRIPHGKKESSVNCTLNWTMLLPRKTLQSCQHHMHCGTNTAHHHFAFSTAYIEVLIMHGHCE